MKPGWSASTVKADVLINVHLLWKWCCMIYLLFATYHRNACELCLIWTIIYKKKDPAATFCNCAISNDQSYSLHFLNSRCSVLPTITHPLLWIIMHNGQHISAHLSSCCRVGSVPGEAGVGVLLVQFAGTYCRVTATISPRIFVACRRFSISHLSCLYMLWTC